VGVKNAAAVFVHGLFSSSKAWDPLAKLLREDDEVTEIYDLVCFDYSSPKWSVRPTRRIPDFGIAAASLKTLLDVEARDYLNVVLVAHSQGGLVVQRYLAEMLADGRGRDLARISRVVLFACPNNGSEFSLVMRRARGILWHHPQERQLRPYADTVADTQRRIINNIVHADAISSDRCPIAFRVYVGESDNIVTPASARSTFPDWGALPGDHNSILRAGSVNNRTFTTLKTNLLQALLESSQNTPRAPLEAPMASLSPQGNLEYRTPLMKVTKKTSGFDSTEIEFFDPDAIDVYLKQDKVEPPPTGEEADVDG
jgi:pimeloyl-ACP methyl ester carboxylesterase